MSRDRLVSRAIERLVPILCTMRSSPLVEGFSAGALLALCMCVVMPWWLVWVVLIGATLTIKWEERR